MARSHADRPSAQNAARKEAAAGPARSPSRGPADEAARPSSARENEAQEDSSSSAAFGLSLASHAQGSDAAPGDESEALFGFFESKAGPSTYEEAIADHRGARQLVQSMVSDNARRPLHPSAGPQDHDNLLINSARMVEDGRVEAYVLTPTHDAEERAEGKGESGKVAMFDGATPLPDLGGSYAPDACSDREFFADPASPGFRPSGADQVVFVEPQLQGEAKLQEILIHELQHAVDEHDAGDLDDQHEELALEEGSYDPDRYLSEFRAYWIGDAEEGGVTDFRSADEPASNSQAVKGKVDGEQKSAKTAFKNGRQEDIFWFMVDAGIYVGLQEAYLRHEEFRQIVHDTVGAQSVNPGNSPQVDRLLDALSAPEPNMDEVRAAAAELDALDREVLADPDAQLWAAARDGLDAATFAELQAAVASGAPVAARGGKVRQRPPKWYFAKGGSTRGNLVWAAGRLLRPAETAEMGRDEVLTWAETWIKGKDWDRTVKRGEAAAILARLSLNKSWDAKTLRFDDVSEADFFHEPSLWARHWGIFRGGANDNLFNGLAELGPWGAEVVARAARGERESLADQQAHLGDKPPEADLGHGSSQAHALDLDLGNAGLAVKSELRPVFEGYRELFLSEESVGAKTIEQAHARLADLRALGDDEAAEALRVILFRVDQRALVATLDVDNADASRYAPDGDTYCNVYAYDVVTAMGAYLPRVWWQAKPLEALAQDPDTEVHGKYPHATVKFNGFDWVAYTEMKANMLVQWLPEYGVRYGWRKAAGAKAGQDAANDGRIVIVIATGKDISGHVAVILSETKQETTTREASGDSNDVTMSQAGWANFERGNGNYTTPGASGGPWWEDSAHADGAFWVWEGGNDGPIPKPEDVS